jgi:mRNA-degrading endonuclease toxin of MazEF toxin-antitoxin module
VNRGEVWWYQLPEEEDRRPGCILTIPKVLLTERITSLEPPKLAELCRALNTAVDC